MKTIYINFVLFCLPGKKRVSFEEFLPIYHSVYQKKATPSLEEFIEGFRVFDRDGTGTVQAAELRNLLTTLGESTNLYLTLSKDNKVSLALGGGGSDEVVLDQILERDVPLELKN